VYEGGLTYIEVEEERMRYLLDEIERMKSPDDLFPQIADLAVS
jgi:hypothetical protein